MVSRALVRVPVPPGPEGPARLLPALSAALAGSGPAIAPVPTVSTTVSNDYVMSLLAALRPDDPALPLESDEVAAAVATSGSTGSPRGVLLTAAQLTSMTEAVHGPGARPQWIAALPVTSMGGLNVVVRALAADREPVSVGSIGGAGPFTSTAFAEAVAAGARMTDDLRTSLVPAQLARLLGDDRGIAALQQCAMVLVGGAATRPSLLDAARELGISVTTTYGATETSGGCVLDGRPLPGVTVTADPQTGVLAVAGPCVALGYRGEPELSARVLTVRGYLTPDVGEVTADGRVVVHGRADDIVVVQGVNVSPLAVERVLADLPDVAAVGVVAAPGPDGDPALHAFVEVRESAPGLEEDGRAAVAERLGSAARPRVHRVPRLPHLPNGKVDRRLLQEWAGKGTD
jgi:O-succinylbenzoic acid--CoA ligase